MANNRRKIGILIAFGAAGFITLLVVLSIAIFDALKEGARSLAAGLPTTYTLPSEDSTLIAKKYISNLKVDHTDNSKDRGPISVASFAERYQLVIYKINLSKDGMLRNIFHADIAKAEATVGVTYGFFNASDMFIFKYQTKPTSPVSDIYLTIYGDSLKNLITNDTIVSYHLLCKTLAIKYAENDPIDIYVAGNEGFFGITSIIPIDLLFLKRGLAVYLLMMTTSSPNSSIPPDMLYNIVLGK